MNFAHFYEGFSDSLFPSFPSVPSSWLRQIPPEPEDLHIEPMNPEPDPASDSFAPPAGRRLGRGVSLIEVHGKESPTSVLFITPFPADRAPRPRAISVSSDE
jgi:hypothetical protein